MSNSLFMFTVGPVQSFISKARKTQDLYAGSFILSYLCRAGMNKIKEYNSEIIFPDIDNAYVPNRFLAIINGETKVEELQEIGKSVEKEVRRAFTEMGDVVLKRLRISNKPAGFDEQIKHHLEIYWVFMPFDKKEYLDCYKKMGSNMGSVKNIRCFEQLEEESGRKCSIDGEHNALFYKDINRRRAFITNKALRLNDISDKYLDDGEALGAVSFLKRCVDRYFNLIGESYDAEFPSTPHIALTNALHRLEDINTEYKGISERKFDADLVYKLKEDQNASVDTQDQTAKEIYELLDKERINYSPYYAMMLFDGDDIGKWYCGYNLKDGAILKDFQTRLSKELGHFAIQLREEVLVFPRGKPIYTGGEDFLGLINLDHIVNVMKELRERFARLDLSSYSTYKLTFSAGIAIAHYKTPLAEVLKWARRMGQEAKGRDTGKDAFGVAVLKHSGEIEKTVLPWKTNEGTWTVDLIQACLELLKDDKFSTNFIKSIDMEFSKMMVDGDLITGAIDNPDVLFESEINRLLKRSCEMDGKDKSRPREIERFELILKQLRVASRKPINFINALRIIRFLAKEVKYINVN